jgi:hypothetical protein
MCAYIVWDASFHQPNPNTEHEPTLVQGTGPGEGCIICLASFPNSDAGHKLALVQGHARVAALQHAAVVQHPSDSHCQPFGPWTARLHADCMLAQRACRSAGAVEHLLVLQAGCRCAGIRIACSQVTLPKACNNNWRCRCCYCFRCRAYRARAVRDPRGLLSEFGTTLAPGTAIRVHDSTADLR